jgi:outer membrane immunogenic protein
MFTAGADISGAEDFRMKRIFIPVAAAASLLTSGAFAADLAPRMYTKAPAVVAAIYDWTGFYVGGNVGYSWGRSNSQLALLDAGTIVSAANSKFDMNGAIGGGQLGYNWQRDKWVFGLEGDIQASGQQGSTYTTCAGNTTVFTNASPTFPASVVNSACSLGHVGDTGIGNVGGQAVTDALSQKLDWFGTFRGRIGSTFIAPTFLTYVTGGLAIGDIKSTNTVTGNNVTNPAGNGVNGGTILTPVGATMSNSTVRAGWTLGVGIEGVVSGNWTAKLEYLYMDFGNVSGSFITPVVGPSGGFLTASYNSHITDNILRVGLNYRFTGPVVAKY